MEHNPVRNPEYPPENKTIISSLYEAAETNKPLLSILSIKTRKPKRACKDFLLFAKEKELLYVDFNEYLDPPDFDVRNFWPTDKGAALIGSTTEEFFAIVNKNIDDQFNATREHNRKILEKLQEDPEKNKDQIESLKDWFEKTKNL